MEKIIIVGCGQHANVVLYNVKNQGKYEALGFFESNPDKVGREFHGLKVLEFYKEWDLKELINKYKTNKFFIGFGNMKYRRLVYNEFVNAGWEAVNIYHPDAVISEEAKIGNGVLIEAGCLITPNPIIGDNVVVNTGSQVNHDNTIGNHVYIASGVVLSGGVIIKDNTLIDDGVIVTLGRKIGANCIIGAGSIVTKDIEDNVVVYGAPAKVIRSNNNI
ncbi:NeuD/PglB/VioB family sugar acetyltransferase [Tissierella sp. MSJ-40]|uniref:NeuD/PglB/VioB family sugar acetyltransferase n=1 Tax=Tissierella simiarum TaxID=2841534 RepID=A0ABS6E3I9_9FIRM|nr:NeuD/PglB/VioB family sugar acetyltransferase [Tissierella simiarum]MBU5436824.1 NeuD/PglB/VioB family sugar acetyltransferase [Tissierella simiarum]